MVKAALIGLALSCACAGMAKADAAAGGTISGAAVDPVTGRGIEGAIASVHLGLETRIATTDSSGAFVLDAMPEGRGFAIGVAREGHRAALVTTDISPGDTSFVRVELPSVFLSLRAPYGPVHLVAGTDLAVRWESGGIGSVRIEFSADGGERWMILAGRIDASAGEWTWPVPDIPTSRGVIRITAPDRPGIEDRSAAFIAITST